MIVKLWDWFFPKSCVITHYKAFVAVFGYKLYHRRPVFKCATSLDNFCTYFSPLFNVKKRNFKNFFIRAISIRSTGDRHIVLRDVDEQQPAMPTPIDVKYKLKSLA